MKSKRVVLSHKQATTNSVRQYRASRLKEHSDTNGMPSNTTQGALFGSDELMPSVELSVGTESSIAIHDALRRHGVEGEEAFLALASHYLDRRNIANRDFSFFPVDRGFAALKIVSHDKHALSILDRIVSDDPQGHELATWYQFFVGRRFREGSGKFFTPRTVAAAMAKLLPIQPGAILMDPTCGGGTFLGEASLRWQGLHCQLVGNDVDRMLVGLTELVLTLSTPSDHEYELLSCNLYDANSEFRNLSGKVNGILANPPFSLPLSRVAKPRELFLAGYRNSDALFLDVCLDLLSPGGNLVCLLPHSLVANAEFELLRRTVEKNWDLCGVITLPEGVFYLTGNTTTRADIVHLRKRCRRNSRTHKVFFANAPTVGFPLNSRTTFNGENSLGQIANDPRVLDCAGKVG